MDCFKILDSACDQIIKSQRVSAGDSYATIFIKRSNRPNARPFIFKLSNANQLNLSCLLVLPEESTAPSGLVCLYLHGNGGNKLESLQLLNYLPEDCALLSFDFAGCGKSDGQHITYGSKQKQDIQLVIQHVLRSYPELNRVALWARSMGALCAIEYLAINKQTTVQAVVLDSPFPSIQEIFDNCAEQRNMNFFVVKIGKMLIKRRIASTLGFDLFQVNYKDGMSILPGQYPILFAYGEVDRIVRRDNVLTMYQAYHGPKQLISMPVQHHEQRKKQFFEEGIGFILRSRQKWRLAEE